MYDPGVPCIVYRVPGLGARAVLSVGVQYLLCPVSMRTVRVPYQTQTPHESLGAHNSDIPLRSLYVAATYKSGLPFSDFGNSHQRINCCTNYQRTAGQGCHLGGIEGLVGKLRLERDLRAAEHGGVHQFPHRHKGSRRRCDRKHVDDEDPALQAPP